MPGVLVWGWDTDNEKWIQILVDSEGRLQMSIVIARLDDIADVNVPSPSDDDVLYWDDAAGEWKAKAISAGVHASTHENGGADEISVAGLSGLLADDQHVLDAEAVSAMGAKGDANPLHHDKYTDAAAKAAAVQAGAITNGVTKAPTHDAVYDVKVTADKSKTLTLTFIIDGGGSAITTGEKGHLRIPFACTINRVTMMADQSGSIVVDIWKDTYANFPPTDADSITASAPPTISSAQKSEDSTLTGWTTAITADDILAFNVDSVATVTRVTISLKVTKS